MPRPTKHAIIAEAILLMEEQIMNYRPPEAPVVHSRLPARILLLAGAALCLVNILFTRLPGLDCLFVHYWVYLVLWGLPIVCFVGALGMAIYQRITTRLASRITLVVVGTILAFGLIFIYTLCATMSTLGEHPVAYYASPEGARRLVVMKSSVDGENSAYTVYPMKSKYFYLATAGQSLETNSGIDTVTWLSEDVAQVTMLDAEDNEVLFTVDFNNPPAESDGEAAEE